MSRPLSNSVLDNGNAGEAARGSVPESSPAAPAAAKETVSVWRPVITRVVFGGLALLGLAGVGAASMLAGLDGARANPPSATAPPLSVNVPALASAASSSRPSQVARPDGEQANSNLVSAATPAAQNACAAGRTAEGKVILNLATMEDLRTLPSIGPKRAQAILTLREKLKRFHRVQELRRVRGIGAKTLQKLSPKLLIDPPPGTCAPPAVDANAKKT
jgi:competence protein ComEA